jgi:hypothetical protein
MNNKNTYVSLRREIEALSDSEAVEYLINKILSTNKHVSVPEPRYDDVFYDGVDWLNSLC